MNLQRAKICARGVNGVGVIASLWGFIYPCPYIYAMGVLLIVPILALFCVHYSEGVLKLDGRRNSTYPTVAPALLLPSLILCFRALMDYSILCWAAFWLPFIAGLALLFWAINVLVKDIRRDRMQLGMGLLFCGMYAYASVITLNGILDSSQQTSYEVYVLEKRISKGSKHKSYYLRISPWGPQKESQEIDVGKRVYQMHEVGGSVTVVLKSGMFNIPWYHVK